MFKINIVCTGTLKEKYFLSAQSEYLKRLSRFCQINITELQEQFLPQNPTENEIKNALDKEYQQLLPYLKGKILVCDPNGEQLTSEEFSKKLIKCFDTNNMITFVIGSSYGLSSKIKTNTLISFSKLTFPHHLMRIFLEEQIYRAFCINSNVAYHK